MPLHLIADDKIPFLRGEAERLGRVTYLPGDAIAPEHLREADALIIRTRTRCDAALLRGSNVRFIATATIGHDHLDKTFLREAGIGWTNCPGCNAGSVAQYVESALLLLHAAGRIDLRSAVLGIVGVGHVGSRVAQMARRRGLRLLLCDPPRRTGRGGPGGVEVDAAECTASLADIARQADVITLHTPLTTSGPDATHHLISAPLLDALRRRPVLINASRGEVVDTAALLSALSQGTVSEAVIDTWENEPTPSAELLERAFLATPHVAGYSADGKATGTRMALEAVARHFGLSATFSVAAPPLPGGFAYYPALAPGLDALPLPAPADSDRLRLYDPRRDSDALKAHPGRFEQLRGNYPLRREAF